jgi:hypothetical protein
MTSKDNMGLCEHYIRGSCKITLCFYYEKRDEKWFAIEGSLIRII